MSLADNAFMRELVTVFAAEADERLAAIDQRLLAFERTRDPDEQRGLLDDIKRELHTLKGSSGAVDMTDAHTLSHALETLFGRVDPNGTVDTTTVDMAYRALDALRQIIACHVDGVDAPVDLPQLLTAMEHLDDGGASDAAPPAPADAAPATPPVVRVARAGVDPMAALIADRAGTDEASPRRVGAAQADETVRLTTAKLDSLMARVSELVAARIGSERRVADVRTIVGLVEEFAHGWERARPQLLGVLTALEAGDTTDVPVATRDLRGLAPLIGQNDRVLHELTSRLAELRDGLQSDDRRFGQVTSELEDEVRRTRMLPIATVFDPLHRLVRDLGRTLGKECVLVIHGGETEVDRSVLEHLRAPLTHLIRNSLDHAIEPPGLREMASKPREGTIRLAASERGGTLHLSIADDGAGIDVNRVRARALESGLVTPDQLRTLTDRDGLRLIFRSGLSTSAAVTDISGRGVGLDAVRETVERLHGSIDLSSEIGAGTTFMLSVPLSVATTQSLLVRVSHHTFALPINSVSRIVQIDDEDIQRAQGREMIVINDGPIVLARLEDVLQLTTLDSDVRGRMRKPAIVIGQGERRFALLVDELLGTQDIVVKPLPRPFTRVRHAAGATVLGTGDVVIVLNSSDLVRSAVRTAVRVDAGVPRRSEGPAAGRPAGNTVLVVDDSIVTRMLEKSILEAAGYTVRVAADGVEAWKLLESEPVDLIVSDVNMPNMDGLALTAHVRADSRTKDTPVVIVTSLDSSDDHTRAMEVGADAYIVKSSFSQESLLETVGRLVSPSG